jgi:hypothetical protein
MRVPSVPSTSCPAVASRRCITAPTRSVTRPPTPFVTKGEARAWLNMQQQTDIIRRPWQPPEASTPRTTLTFEAYAEQWLSHRQLKTRTREHYRKRLDHHLLGAFGAMPPASVTAHTAVGRTPAAGTCPSMRLTLQCLDLLGQCVTLPLHLTQLGAVRAASPEGARCRHRWSPSAWSAGSVLSGCPTGCLRRRSLPDAAATMVPGGWSACQSSVSSGVGEVVGGVEAGQDGRDGARCGHAGGEPVCVVREKLGGPAHRHVAAVCVLEQLDHLARRAGALDSVGGRQPVGLHVVIVHGAPSQSGPQRGVQSRCAPPTATRSRCWARDLIEAQGRLAVCRKGDGLRHGEGTNIA